MSAILSAENVVFQQKIYYPKIEIPEGQATFLQGPSGCGKSTLLHLFNGTLSITEGKILYQNRDIQQLDKIILRHEVLLASQQSYLFPGSILDNFQQYHHYRESTLPEHKQLQQYLDICHIPFPLNQNVAHLSGGEKQRVFLAIALSFNAKVLMLDEPTSALDPTVATQVIQQIKQFCLPNTTLIIISHDHSLTQRYADKIIELNHRGHYE
ncbi:ABC transporter ATP-binding protein [Gallibacterium genomosp. 3]|uniref:Glutamine ABC transporter ATP-binding protein n=1 Tax=Gallibacterium genomosp. 3 TaxID=505345 RepID=A0A1A7PVN7_9PAST|nr:ABC transporter ATP-binding protein [Gallibacterium genomosp. 3]OBX06104.1 glutamine ABC transporter ATP-binding protein [Gallibacterium genomosp. 3]